MQERAFERYIPLSSVRISVSVSVCLHLRYWYAAQKNS